jgi:hypothetical protein
MAKSSEKFAMELDSVVSTPPPPIERDPDIDIIDPDSIGWSQQKALMHCLCVGLCFDFRFIS